MSDQGEMMNPECPCDSIPGYDGPNHAEDMGACRLCYENDRHRPECNCEVRIAGALSDAKHRMDKLEYAMLDGVAHGR